MSESGLRRSPNSALVSYVNSTASVKRRVAREKLYRKESQRLLPEFVLLEEYHCTSNC